MKLVWRARALADLEGIMSYIAERSEPAAERLQSAMEACADGLIQHPFLYRQGRAKGTREAVVHPNYILIYRIRAETVEIVRVVHSRQQYP
jgi:addiction module RelE/StbE family toxin